MTRSYSYNSRHNNGLMVGSHNRYQPSASDVSILSQYCRAGSRGSRGSLLSQSGTACGIGTPTRMSCAGSSRDSLSKSGVHRLSGSGTSTFLEINRDGQSTSQCVASGRSLKNVTLSPSPLSGSPTSCTKGAFPSIRAPSPTNNSSSNGSDQRSSKSERKLSTVLETSHASSEPVSDDGCGMIGGVPVEGTRGLVEGRSKIAEEFKAARDACVEIHARARLDDQRILQGRDSLRDLFEGQPHGRVRSASEYVVIFKAEESESSPSAKIASPREKGSRVCEQGQQHRLSRAGEGHRCRDASERRISRDTVLSNNTVSSLLSTNTVSSLTSEPIPSSSQASDAEHNNTENKKSSKLNDKRHFFPLDSFDKAASHKEDDSASMRHSEGKLTKEAHAEELPLSVGTVDDIFQGSSSFPFIDVLDEDSTTWLVCSLDSKEVLNGRHGSTKGRISATNSGCFSEDTHSHTKYCWGDKTNDETFSDLNTVELSSIFSSDPNSPQISFEVYRQGSLNNGGSSKTESNFTAKTKKASFQSNKSHGNIKTAASERDALLTKSCGSFPAPSTRGSLVWSEAPFEEESERHALLAKNCVSLPAPSAPGSSVWSEAPVDDEAEDEEDDDLERDFRVRERKKRRKKRKKMKHSTSYVHSENNADVSSAVKRLSPVETDNEHDDFGDERDDRIFLESLLQAV